jgi:tetratricopeptide (TPR) repeat protein
LAGDISLFRKIPDFLKENTMVRWFSVMLVVACLALGGGAQCAWAQTAQDKVKAANEKAAQDYFKYGLNLAEEGRNKDAAKAFGQALGIKPGWAEAHSLRGSALAQAGDLNEAEKELRQAVQLKPDYAEGWNFLGEFLKDHGKQKEAEEAFAKAKQFSRRP